LTNYPIFFIKILNYPYWNIIKSLNSYFQLLYFFCYVGALSFMMICKLYLQIWHLSTSFKALTEYIIHIKKWKESKLNLQFLFWSFLFLFSRVHFKFIFFFYTWTGQYYDQMCILLHLNRVNLLQFLYSFFKIYFMIFENNNFYASKERTTIFV
jgi:hypothetical protein